jgi:mRNA-degrading endonuclease RelE of RelBE toxin-antitoxin system
MEFLYTPTAQAHLERLPHEMRKRISSKMRFYARQPDPLEFAEPLSGSHNYRFRIGDYRVIFKVVHDAIWIRAIKRRDKAYH